MSIAERNCGESSSAGVSFRGEPLSTQQLADELTGPLAVLGRDI
jgi:hypothetical protein